MTHQDLVRLLEAAAADSGHSFNRFALESNINRPPTFEPDKLDAIISYLGDMAYMARMTLVTKALTIDELKFALATQEKNLLVFVNQPGPDGKLYPQPWWLSPTESLKGNGKDAVGKPALDGSANWRSINESSFYAWGQELPQKLVGKLPVMFFYPLRDYTSEHRGNPAKRGGNTDGHHQDGHHGQHHHLSPVKRLFILLKPERKDIWYIYLFAITIGLINLTLPLGTQAIIGLISGGMVFNSVILLISMVVIGVLIGGGLQIMQLSVVEILQRRIFTRAAFEFAYRVPRLKINAIHHTYAPEQMNRFFEVPNIQKSIPKLLIDLTAAVLQTFFGLILLAFYHPFFVVFGLFLFVSLGLFIAYYAPQGMRSSISESKYKYRVVAWFQDMARALIPFKMTGDTNLAVAKTDEYVNHYLYHRKKHFNILIAQYGGILAFKAIVTAGLLIIGTYLVVDRQITLGQFVASEIVIITVLAAIEKIISSLDVIYDTLTAVDKIGHVTDFELEPGGGIEVDTSSSSYVGPLIEVKDLGFAYEHGGHEVLHGISFKLNRRQHLCLAGGTGSGKHTLVKVLLGLYGHYHGEILVGNVSLRDISLANLRRQIGENAINNEIFEGNIFENVAMGRPGIYAHDVKNILNELGLGSTINKLHDGLYTNLTIGTPILNATALYLITLARTLLGKPDLVIIDDTLQKLGQADKLRVLSYLQDPQHNWAVIYLSNDALIQAACTEVIRLENGHMINLH